MIFLIYCNGTKGDIIGRDFYSFYVNNKNNNLLILSNDTYFNTIKFILEVEN